MRRFFAAAVAASIAGLSIASCLEPTQVRVTVTTDVCDLAKVTFLRNGAEVATTNPAQACVHIGDLVFVPSKTRDRFILEVQGILPGGNCKPGSPTCVTVRRSVTFQSHAAFELPIALSRSCIGVVCDAATQTCDRGSCVPIPSACQHPPCDTPDASIDDAGSDAGIDSGDAGVDADSGADAGPACDAGFTSPFMFGTLRDSWDFEEGTSPINDSVMNKTTAVPDYVFVQSIKACGFAFELIAGNAAKPPAQAGIGITVSMLVQIPKNNVHPPILSGDGALNGSWDIDFLDDSGLDAIPRLVVNGNVAGFAQSKLNIPYDGQFHLFEISASGNSAAFSVDGSPVDVQTITRTIADSQNLRFGVNTKIAIDELKIYKAASW